MENIRAFYDDFLDKLLCIEPTKAYKNESYNVYPTEIVDNKTIYDYVDIITNKLLSLQSDNRNIYVKLAVKNINAYKTVIEELIDRNFSDKIIYGRYLGIIYVKLESEASTDEILEEHYENRRLSNLYKENMSFFDELIFQLFHDFNLDIDSLRLCEDNTDIKLKEVIKSNIGVGEKRGSQFTSKRQTFAIVELLSELGVNSNTVDKTSIASFIQFLTGRQTESLPQNTTAYKLIERKDPDSEKEKNSFNNDCDFVASYFESVGLISLADKIKRGKV